MALELGESESARRYARLATLDPHHLAGQRARLQQLEPTWGAPDFTEAHTHVRTCAMADRPDLGIDVLFADLALEQWAFESGRKSVPPSMRSDLDIASDRGPSRRRCPMKHRSEQPGRGLGAGPIHPTTVLDGVPVLWGPHPDGEYAAGLVFRVGRADETLATSGVTHLVEHLALHEHGMSDLHYNGTTADLFTHFFVHGTSEHVTEYLHGVCAGLRDLPVQRMETEKRILANEAEGRSGGPSVLYRHGAQGHGLPAYPELGLHGLRPDQVRAWAARHFTAGNAALWISGEQIPPSLRLDLPEGPRVPPPAVTSALPGTPAWFGQQGNSLVASGLLPRSAATQVFAQVLDRVLFRDLRQRDGISYRAGTDYAPLDRDTAVVWAIADCSPEQRRPGRGVRRHRGPAALPGCDRGRGDVRDRGRDQGLARPAHREPPAAQPGAQPAAGPALGVDGRPDRRDRGGDPGRRPGDGAALPRQRAGPGARDRAELGRPSPGPGHLPGRPAVGAHAAPRVRRAGSSSSRPPRASPGTSMTAPTPLCGSTRSRRCCATPTAVVS